MASDASTRADESIAAIRAEHADKIRQRIRDLLKPKHETDAKSAHTMTAPGGARVAQQRQASPC
jgi:hypothetical protein